MLRPPAVPAADVGGRRIAVVHDWLTGMRGGEAVLEAVLELVPDARLLTLVHVPGAVAPWIESHDPQPSFVQHLPRARTHYRQYLPLFPTAIEQFDLDDVDLVISTSHCAAKSVVPTGRARHLCYCHTPMRYAWDQFDAYFGPARVGKLRSRLYGFAMRYLARWDRATANRVDRYVANSHYVAARIGRYYNRRADVIEPPVDTDFYSPDGSAPGDYLITVSALVPYKRVDLAIEACDLAGVRLRVVGSGPEAGRLRDRAGSAVEFIERCSQTELRRLYRGARAFLLTGEEDFGIAPVEAQACGRPVVALARGGACETVAHETTGLLVPDTTAGAFAAAIRALDGHEFDPVALRRSASRFARRRFQARMRASIEDLAAAIDAPRDTNGKRLAQ
jgi:glycosyltransferase involved in cell wall biosynthesis